MELWPVLTQDMLNGFTTRKFITHFGVTPLVMEMLWQFLMEVRSIHFQRKHLLWTMHFLKCYPLQDVGAAFCRSDSKTWHKWIWLTITTLYQCLDMVSV